MDKTTCTNWESEIFSIKSKYCQSDINSCPLLYHYSSVDGCIGIISNRTIWASSFERMNDKGEFRHGMDLWIPKSIELIRKITEDNSPKNEFIQKLEKFFLDEYKDPEARPYVASFTSEKNSPSLWSKYGDRGHGAAVGIQFTNFINGNSILLPIIYDDVKKSEIIEQVLSDLEKLISQYAAIVQKYKREREFYAAIILALIQIMFAQSARMKKTKWETEQEWRLITFVKRQTQYDQIHGAIKYRSRSTSIVDYLELNILGLPAKITELVAGPRTTDFELNSWSLFWEGLAYPSHALSRAKDNRCLMRKLSY